MPLGRKRSQRDTPVGPGTQACPLCGEVVPVGEDGRCDLGHRVHSPHAAADQTQPLSVPAEDEPTVPVAPLAGPAAAGLTLGEAGDADADADEAEAAAEDEDEDENKDDKPEPDFSSELDW